MAGVFEDQTQNTTLNILRKCLNNSLICNSSFPNNSVLIDSASTNNNSTRPYPEVWVPSKHLKISLCILYSLIFICGVLGNAVVCFVLGVKNKKKNRYDILLVSLAIADLLASMFGPLIMISDLAGDLNRWYFGAAMCKLLPAISPITLIASSWSLAMISYDRHRVLTRTGISRESLDVKIIAGQVVFIWAIAIGISLPYVLGTDLRGDECYTISTLSNNTLVIYAVSWVLIGWGIPLAVVTFFSVAITRILKKDTEDATSCTVVLRRIERNRKVFQMFVLILLAFFLLTTPYSIFYAVGTYLIYLEPKHTNLNTLKQLNYALFVLMVANSCVNPIIYAKMHRDISRYARSLFDSACCSGNPSRKHSTKRCEEFVLSPCRKLVNDELNGNSPTASYLV